MKEKTIYDLIDFTTYRIHFIKLIIKEFADKMRDIKWKYYDEVDWANCTKYCIHRPYSSSSIYLLTIATSLMRYLDKTIFDYIIYPNMTKSIRNNEQNFVFSTIQNIYHMLEIAWIKKFVTTSQVSYLKNDLELVINITKGQNIIPNQTVTSLTDYVDKYNRLGLDRSFFSAFPFTLLDMNILRQANALYQNFIPVEVFINTTNQLIKEHIDGAI